VNVEILLDVGDSVERALFGDEETQQLYWVDGAAA